MVEDVSEGEVRRIFELGERQRVLAVLQSESRLKDLLGVPRGTSLRFWKWKPSASDAAPNAQWTLTEERVEALYRQYAAVTGGAAPSETELAVSLEGRES